MSKVRVCRNVKALSRTMLVKILYLAKRFCQKNIALEDPFCTNRVQVEQKWTWTQCFTN